ncbi:MAG: heme-binding domain-containing protein [Bacteroidales bacterium]|nr:heme-binding domain-containing protein [Bacteroidales bacterium]
MKKRNRKLWRYLFGTLIVLFVVIQFIPVHKPKVIKDNPNDFLLNTKMPAHVASMFQESCYDCHSNQTKYPWYARIAPSSWLLASDVTEGRAHVNFSNWTKMSKAQQIAALSDIASEVKSGDMPFWAYPIMHPKARMSKADRKELVDWAQKYQNEIFYSK